MFNLEALRAAVGDGVEVTQTEWDKAKTQAPDPVTALKALRESLRDCGYECRQGDVMAETCRRRDRQCGGKAVKAKPIQPITSVEVTTRITIVGNRLRCGHYKQILAPEDAVYGLPSAEMALKMLKERRLVTRCVIIAGTNFKFTLKPL